MLKAERGVAICALHLKVQATSATQFGYNCMREPREYEAPLCAQVDGELWFPEHGGDSTGVAKAVRICNQCHHRIECAEWGIHNERYGIWGGLTAVQRESLRRKSNIKLPRERSA